jgi:hypothetical protein
VNREVTTTGLGPADVEVEVMDDLVQRQGVGEITAVAVGPWTAYLVARACQAAVAWEQRPRPENEVWRAVAGQFEKQLSGTAAASMLSAGWERLGREGL